MDTCTFDEIPSINNSFNDKKKLKLFAQITF